MALNSDVLKGRYEIQRHLGQRSGQRTLLAKDRQTQDLVVVKLLTFGGELTWEKFKLFEREAKVLENLEHQAIPRYLDYFDVETNFGRGFALVQSYINAPSLEAHIKAGRTFSEIELKQIAKAVLEILVYLHQRHPPIIHRDIKPGNILLNDRSGNNTGRVYLVDFGSVQAVTSEPGTRTVVGTYGYMPPEQFGGRARPASDLYGLGATIIYLASGQHPADLPQKDFRISFENHVSLSSTFVDWLQWLTQPSLEKRLQSASQALQALEHQTLQKEYAIVHSKPVDSRVILTKEANRLEICIPPRGFNCSVLLPRIVAAILSNGFSVIWYSLAIASGYWWPVSVGIISSVPGLMFILDIWFTLFEQFGQIKLQIDQKKISLRYQLFGLRYYSPRSAVRDGIIKVEVELKSQINIWAGTKKFSMVGVSLLSETELNWLAHELSDWLDLPIIREK